MRSDRSSIDSVPRIIRRLFGPVATLEHKFPKKRFTLDGHLVGSIGEVVAALRYRLDLLPVMPPTHEAVSLGRIKRKVQIKATQVHRVGIRSKPQHLVVLAIDQQGKFREVYNGPGVYAWDSAGRKQGNGQRYISVHRLKELQNKNVRDKLFILAVRKSLPQLFAKGS